MTAYGGFGKIVLAAVDDPRIRSAAAALDTEIASVCGVVGLIGGALARDTRDGVIRGNPIAFLARHSGVIRAEEYLSALKGSGLLVPRSGGLYLRGWNDLYRPLIWRREKNNEAQKRYRSKHRRNDDGGGGSKHGRNDDASRSVITHDYHDISEERRGEERASKALSSPPLPLTRTSPGDPPSDPALPPAAPPPTGGRSGSGGGPPVTRTTSTRARGNGATPTPRDPRAAQALLERGVAEDLARCYSDQAIEERFAHELQRLDADKAAPSTSDRLVSLRNRHARLRSLIADVRAQGPAPAEGPPF